MGRKGGKRGREEGKEGGRKGRREKGKEGDTKLFCKVIEKHSLLFMNLSQIKKKKQMIVSKKSAHGAEEMAQPVKSLRTRA